MVQSLLQYSCLVWDPYSQGQPIILGIFLTRLTAVPGGREDDCQFRSDMIEFNLGTVEW